MKTLNACTSAALLLALLSPALAEPAGGNRGSMKEKMQQFDTDGDGKLSPDERAAMKTAAGERKNGGKPAGAADGEGKAGLQQKILAQFDSNGNGKLDPDEQVAARKAASERRKSKKANPNGEAGGGFNPGDGINQLNGQQPGGGGGAGQRGDGRAKLLERFDLNRDGQLSNDEMARAQQMMQKLGGPGGPGGGNLPPGIGQPGGRPNVKPPRQFKQ